MRGDKINELKFRRDTTFRNLLFTPDSFAHPAKMDAQLLIWIVEKYTKVGEMILDPMAGMGTTMLACMQGRHCILVELEQKFIDMAKANWGKVKMMPQLGYEMGNCQILQGDARNLEGIVDGIITSPPYAETLQGSGADAARKRISEGRYKGLRPDVWTSKGNIAGSTFGDGYSQDKANISNLPYGSIDSVITSPPFADSFRNSKQDSEKRFQRLKEVEVEAVKKGQKWAVSSDETIRANQAKQDWGYGEHPENIGNKPYGNIDSIITSPPYENQIHKGTGEWSQSPEGRMIGGQLVNGGKMLGVPQGADYIKSQDNIGNLKSDSYLSAMLQVYQQCHKVLKPQGLLILVTKNFIRNKKEIRLDEDTVKLCEQAGFQFAERHYRKLTAQSFWRVIYNKKYPDAPVLDKEDILVFQRGDSSG